MDGKGSLGLLGGHQGNQGRHHCREAGTEGVVLFVLSSLGDILDIELDDG